MIQLVLHVRPSRLTPDRIAALAAVLAAHPGPNPVRVVSHPDMFLLGVTVNAAAASRPAGLAVDGCGRIDDDTLGF